MQDTQQWFYADGDQTLGPVNAFEIEQLIRQSAISSSTWMLAEGSENWMLATDSPFAEHLENAPSQQSLPDQAPVDAVPTLARPHPSPSVEGQKPHETLSARFSQLGSAVLSETKRSARLASIKAIIEKLKHVDLTKAYYALGKKVYELKIDQDRFSDQFREISTLEETIKTKKAGNAPDESATVMENFRGAAINAKSAVEAEAFEIRRKQWLIKIGKEYRPPSVPTALKAEFEAVERVEIQIKEREAEYASASADRTSFTTLLQLLGSVLPKVGMRASWPSLTHASNWLSAILRGFDVGVSLVLSRSPLKISKMAAYALIAAITMLGFTIIASNPRIFHIRIWLPKTERFILTELEQCYADTETIHEGILATREAHSVMDDRKGGVTIDQMQGDLNSMDRQAAAEGRIKEHIKNINAILENGWTGSQKVRSRILRIINTSTDSLEQESELAVFRYDIASVLESYGITENERQ